MSEQLYKTGFKRIDAHQHYWKLSRGDYGWLTPDSGVLYRDYLPGDLKEHLREQSIDRTIVVQAAPTIEETEYLLALCEEEETLAGVVGWIDLEADDFHEQYARLAANRYFLGIRPMLQDLPDDRWILRPKVISALEKLARDEFPVDLLVKPRHLVHILELMKQVPGLRAVVDHLAKPNIKEGVMEPWSTHIKELAQFPNLYCKLSGMVTEADHEQWRTNDFIPYVHHVVECFGAERVMFGSDWPVCLLAVSYQEVTGLLNECLPAYITEQDKERIFGENASRFYRLDR
ncbi:Predicted metal-dependent hydrolase of the TIM-barrel fold [Chlamydia abortus]|uniref:Amidohydrolase family protein n=1 Tax=Paenibacillus residui TaxID=629724 RepID=A0ABW3D9V4_9BACL|nr:Predicted metal-dependent hydrolase of the TIM-barrel fold [Chlamydia abortus]